MTTLTVEIGREEDLSAVKDFFAKMGLHYKVEEQYDFIYSDDIKNTLDERHKKIY